MPPALLWSSVTILLVSQEPRMPYKKKKIPHLAFCFSNWEKANSTFVTFIVSSEIFASSTNSNSPFKCSENIYRSNKFKTTNKTSPIFRLSSVYWIIPLQILNLLLQGMSLNQSYPRYHKDGWWFYVATYILQAYLWSHC